MTELPFNLELLQFLADHRIDLLTPFVRAISFLGEIEGYVLVIALVYAMVDKRLAMRLSAVVLLAMMLNHVLKILVGNPRPFVADGSYAQKWVASPERIVELASEYSTPSGHAMAGAAFYAQLWASTKSRVVQVLSVLAVLATGLSRPYLGVHYLEDVLIGWALGLGFAWLAVRQAERVARRWDALSHPQQIALAVAGSFTAWAGTLLVNGRSELASPGTFLGYAGFLTGLVIGYPLEARKVGFDSRSSSLALKLVRYALTIALVIGGMLVLDALADLVVTDGSLAGQLARYLRYASAGVIAVLAAPWLCVKLRLADVERSASIIWLEAARARRAASSR